MTLIEVKMSNMPLDPPISALMDVLNDLCGLDEILTHTRYAHADSALAEAIVHEGANFARDVLAPINHTGDVEGAQWENGIVTMPETFQRAYQQFTQQGWNTVHLPTSHGGQQLPLCLSSALHELWNSANMAFTLCPMLTQGAAELVEAFGSDTLKDAYLPNMISGMWTGTMCLTEPQAGSDVGALRTTATPDGEQYRIKGTKIFITYGEHDMAENIIHMVLARLPDAPAGTKGISLFLVPKMLPDGTANDLSCTAIEHKLGIHASPTCVMQFGENDGAIGYLLGEPNTGMKAMFQMMNMARLNVGIEGAGIAERSWQIARGYAEERQQFGQPIANFPDVATMLKRLESHAMALRCLHLYTAALLDRERMGDAESGLDASILVPIIKAHGTQIGFEMSSLALQVHGGMGYVEETGIAQLMRDSRIAQIYEGTNGIQAMDLIGRKLPLDGGTRIHTLLEAIGSAMPKETVEDAKVLCAWMQEHTDHAPALATDFLYALGYWIEVALLHKLAAAHSDYAPLAEWATADFLSHFYGFKWRCQSLG